MMRNMLIALALAGTAAVAVAQAPQATPGVAPPMPSQHRMMMDQPMTRDSVVTKVREMFAALDTNRDGFISADERQAKRAQMRGKWHEHAGQRMASRGEHGSAAMFERMDANHDGSISRAEFDQVHGDMQAMHGERGKGMHKMGRRAHMAMMAHRLMNDADADKDGRVSIAEAQNAALRHFDMMDTNRDGTVTPEERRQMWQQMRSKRAPKGG